jgi:hypothetical protein
MLVKMSARRIYKVTFALLSGGTLLVYSHKTFRIRFLSPSSSKGVCGFRSTLCSPWIGPISRLKNLRAAAKPAMHLVIFDSLMPHVCVVPRGPPPPPSPLLGIPGAVIGPSTSYHDRPECAVDSPLSTHSGSSSSAHRCSQSPLGRGACSRSSYI